MCKLHAYMFNLCTENSISYDKYNILISNTEFRVHTTK